MQSESVPPSIPIDKASQSAAFATQSDTVSAPPIFLSDIAKAASAELCYWLDYDSVTDSMALSLRCKDGVIVDRPEPDEPEVFSSPFSARLLGNLFHPSAASRLDVLSVSPSEKVEICLHGSVSFLVNTRLEARPDCSASASEATNIYDVCSCMGLDL